MSNKHQNGSSQIDERITNLLNTLKKQKGVCQEEKQRLILDFTAKLEENKEALRKAKEMIEKLSSPPNSFGVFLEFISGDNIKILFKGEPLQVTVAVPDLNFDIKSVKKGQLVRLNETLNVIEVLSQFEEIGEEVTLEALLDNGRALVSTKMDEKEVAYFVDVLSVKVGEKLLMTRSHFLTEKLPKSEVEDLVLEEAPDIGYDQIGGLAKQIEAIRDGLEMPYLYPKQFAQYKIRPPKGILLYGPPGCGKTMIAKAIANHIAKEIEKKSGKTGLKGYFLNIKGPELLNKWVGETERKIREVFQKAQEKASEDCPVIIFFDEMDAIFPMRGSGVSSDVEKTSVTMFCTMLDGVEAVKNVIIIGATNRQDLIDPAIVRPGRLDLKIKVERPDEAGAKDILSKYITPDLPLNGQYFSNFNYEDENYIPKDKNGKARNDSCGNKIKYSLDKNSEKIVADYLIPQIVQRLYDEKKPENHFLELTYASGQKETMYLKDFMSGAVLESIVTRAKKIALKRELFLGGDAIDEGIRLSDFYVAIEDEFKENQDLPNTTSGIDEWMRISGKKGEKVVNVRIIPPEEKTAPIETIVTGHYL